MSFRAVLLDIEGTLIIGDQPVPGAAAAIGRLREAGLGLRFLTNATTRSRATLARDLQAASLPVAESEIFSAPRAAAAYIRRTGRRRAFLVAKGSVDRDFDGIDLQTDQPAFVVVGGAEENFTYERMNHAFRYLLAGARLLALHRGKYWRTLDGFSLDAGAYVAALAYASGRRPTLIGKPAPALFRLALADLGAAAAETVVVGDDVDADSGAGQAVGCHGVLVRTGKFREEALAAARRRPDQIIESVARLPDYLLPLTR